MCSLNKTFKRVSHVIFDMDGLILDTEIHNKKAISDIAKSFNKVYTPDIMNKIIGSTRSETCRIAVREMKLPIEPKQFEELFIKHVYNSDVISQIKVMPGAQRLVEHLHKHHIPIAIATSSGDDCFKVKTQNHEKLFELFNHIVLGGSDPEVKNGKPAPDIFLVCASRFADKPKPEKCLVFEDSPNGVSSAVSAGMQVVMVPDPLLDKERTKNATLVLKSLEEFKPELFSLPAF